MAGFCCEKPCIVVNKNATKRIGLSFMFVLVLAGMKIKEMEIKFKDRNLLGNALRKK